MAYVGLSLGERSSRYLYAPHGAQLHLTLAHFEGLLLDEAAQLAQDLEKIANTTAVVDLYPDSLQAFGVGDVLVMKMTDPLMMLRSQVIALLMKQSIPWSQEHEWLPHVTLGKADPRVHQYILGETRIPAPTLELAGTPVLTRYAWPLQGP